MRFSLRFLAGLFLLAGLTLTSASPARAVTPEPATYVLVATFTPTSAGGNDFAFQNTSTSLDVLVKSVDLSISSAAAGGGPLQYWVFGSTAATAGGTSQHYTYSYSTTLASAPSGVTPSTGPVSVTLEASLPILRPLQVNTLTTATTNLRDHWGAGDEAGGLLGTGPLLLPHGANRALVFQKKALGAADTTTGVVQLRILYSVR